MPTNRKRTTRGRRGPPIDPDKWAYLCDETPENPFTMFAPARVWRALWSEHGEEITRKWAEAHPGTRPSHWWKYSAPRLEESDLSPESVAIVPRLQIAGDELDEDTRSMAWGYDRGIPNWMYAISGPDDPDYPVNPPVFESEAAYLKRHGLLLPGEAKRLRL